MFSTNFTVQLKLHVKDCRKTIFLLPFLHYVLKLHYVIWEWLEVNLVQGISKVLDTREAISVT